MAQAIKDNIPDGGGRIALINALSILDRQPDQVHFIEFKSSFRQTFSVTPSDTFVNFDNRNKNYYKDYSNGQRDQQRDGRYRDSRPRDRRPKSPHAYNKNMRAGSGSSSNSCGRQGHSDSRSCFTSVNIHSPSSSTCLIDTGAQRSCMGQRTFVHLGDNPESK